MDATQITLILISGCVTWCFVVSRNKQLCKKLTGVLVWHVSLHFPGNHSKFIALLFLNLAFLKFSLIKSEKKIRSFNPKSIDSNNLWKKSSIKPSQLFAYWLLWTIFILIRPRLHQAPASTLRWCLWHISYWPQLRCLRMGLQPILERLHYGQWELCRKHHHSVDAWCRRALTVLEMRLLSRRLGKGVRCEVFKFGLSSMTKRWLTF